MKRAWLILVIPSAFVLLAVSRPAEPPTITFFVASDSHFGARGMSEVNRTIVEQMNAMPGTPYPPEVGGQVDVPRGVLFLGDNTDNGAIEEFAEFEKVYGLDGKDGLLRYPVFEAIGNHDLNSESPIKPRVEKRHGGINYSWDWDDLHVVCLDMYPDASTLRWLARDLSKVDPRRPIVPYFHYSIEGNYSNSWEPAEKAAFGRALEGRNVPAIFHGHEHRLGHYVWQGYPVFRPGAPRHSSHTFLTVRVAAREMTVTAWNYDDKTWVQSWTVPVERHPNGRLDSTAEQRRSQSSQPAR